MLTHSTQEQASLAPIFLFHKKINRPFCCSSFPKKVTLGSVCSLASALTTPSRRYQPFSVSSCLSACGNLFLLTHSTQEQASLAPIFLFHKKINRPFCCSSFPKKVTLGSVCSLASALTTPSRRYQPFSVSSCLSACGNLFLLTHFTQEQASLAPIFLFHKKINRPFCGFLHIKERAAVKYRIICEQNMIFLLILALSS